jgi:hypothetical protein
MSTALPRTSAPLTPENPSASSPARAAWWVVPAALLSLLGATSIATAWTPTTPPVGVAAWGSTGSDIATSITHDANGNMFVVGYFSGSIDVDPGAGVTTLTSAGGDDAYVMKLDVGGGLQWAIAIGGSTADRAYSVTLAPSGDIVIAGSYSGTFDADPGVGVNTLTSVGSDDAFLMKLDDVTGALVWVRSLGGTYSDAALAVTTDASGNVYSTGSFMNNIDLDPGSGTLMRYAVGTAQTEVFISKLDANGDYSWGGSVGGHSNEKGLAIAVDAGHMYITGYYGQSADFNPDPHDGDSMPGIGNPDDVFVLKLTNAGTYVWSRRVGAGNGTARGTGIAVDGSGNVYTVGYFSGTSADFDPSVSDLLISSSGSSDVFVWKLDSSGLLAWAKTLGSTGIDRGTAIRRDDSGNLYVSGYFNATVDFDPGSNTDNRTSAGLDDAFVTKIDSSGTSIWAKSVGGTGADQPTAISVRGSAGVALAGYFSGTADFDPESSIANVTSLGAEDAFVLAMDPVGSVIPTTTTSTTTTTTTTTTSTSTTTTTVVPGVVVTSTSTTAAPATSTTTTTLGVSTSTTTTTIVSSTTTASPNGAGTTTVVQSATPSTAPNSPVNQLVPISNPTSPRLVDTGRESGRGARWAILALLLGWSLVRLRRIAH